MIPFIEYLFENFAPVIRPVIAGLGVKPPVKNPLENVVDIIWVSEKKLKETVKTDNTEAIKADTEAVEKSFYKISEKLYAQQQAQGGQGFDPNNMGGSNGTVDDDNMTPPEGGWN